MGGQGSKNPPVFDTLITQQQFIDATLDEKTENIWGDEYLQKQKYPDIWTPIYKNRNAGNLQNVVFGWQYQFPQIGFNTITKLQHSSKTFPKINFENVAAPSVKITKAIQGLDAYDKFWEYAYEKRNPKEVISFVWAFFQEEFLDLQLYLNEYFYDQLAWFGLLDDTSDKKPTINIKLNYIPLNYRIPVYISLCYHITEYFKNSTNSPFLNFKTGSVYLNPDYNFSDLPTLQEFNKNIEHYRIELGNFWTDMSNQLHSKEEVMAFWNKHEEIVEPIKRFYKALKEGFLYTAPGIDSYYFRLSFFQLYNFKISGQKVFNFPIFDKYIDDKYCPIQKINHVILLYYNLICKDINYLFDNQFFELPISKPYPRIPFTPINPIDIGQIISVFKGLKELWLNTAEWTYFGKDNNYMNQWGHQFKLTELQQKIYDFIKIYPLRPLKVPPFNFGEWARRTPSWYQVCEIQWNDYFKWVIANVNTLKEPNYAEPGDILLDKDGNEVIITMNKYDTNNVLLFSEKIKLQNNYPDYGVLVEERQPWFGRQFLLLFPILTPADFIWGDEFWGFINNTVRKVFQIIIDTLYTLLKIVETLLPSLLIIAAVVGGYFFITRNEENISITNEK
jgi:hypothetical protein